MKIFLTILFITLFSFSSFCQSASLESLEERISKCTISLLGQKYDNEYVSAFLLKYGYLPSSFFDSEESGSIVIKYNYNTMEVSLNEENLVSSIQYNLDSYDVDESIEELGEILDYWDVNSNFDDSKKKLTYNEIGVVDEIDNKYKRLYTESIIVPYKLEMIWYGDILSIVTVSENNDLAEISSDFSLYEDCLKSNPWGKIILEYSNDEEEGNLYNTLTYESESATESNQQSSKTAMEWYTMGLDATLEEMVEYNTKAIELEPYFEEAYCNRGIAYLNLQKTEEAIEDFTTTVEINPDFAIGYYNRASVYASVGESVKAAEDLKEYLKINGDSDGYMEDVKSLIFQLTGEDYEIDTDVERVQDQKDWLLLGYNVDYLFLLLGELDRSSTDTEFTNLNFSLMWDKIIFIQTLLERQSVTGEAIEEFNELKRLVSESNAALENPNEDTFLNVTFNMLKIAAQIALLRSSLSTYVNNLDIDWKVANKFKRLHKVGDILSDLSMLLKEGEDLTDKRKCNKPCMKEKFIFAVGDCRDADVYGDLNYFIQKAYMNFHQGESDEYVVDYINKNMNRLENGEEVIIGF